MLEDLQKDQLSSLGSCLNECEAEPSSNILPTQTTSVVSLQALLVTETRIVAYFEICYQAVRYARL